jgi:hypothetical protein
LSLRAVVVEGPSPFMAVHDADGVVSFAELFDPMCVSDESWDAREERRAVVRDRWESWLASKDADYEGPDGLIA